MNYTPAQLIALLIPALPLFGFFIHFLFGKWIKPGFSGWIASFWVFVSFLFSASLFLQIPKEGKQHVHLYTWLKSGAFQVDFAFTIDALSSIMMMLITGVGTLIHLYSIGYMHNDKEIRRFFSYLNLFVFFMLILIMADNFILLFAGWEGVGLCSYLLIGFWYQNHAYNAAANKAFIVNRIGDLAFLLGVFLLFQHTGTLTFESINQFFSSGQPVIPNSSVALTTEPLAPGTILAITLLLFLGATGKSAQIPLFTWLPDAMAGPTPVSALIHAATMVTAGIYLILRNHALFMLSPATMDIIMATGLLTSIFGGLVALKQHDCKKILAYSTVSQLGLMFFALGLGAYHAAFFHLLTHAFFKALLFLGAGSVIHALHGEQDIRRMGGLAGKLKLTRWVFLAGVLAIIALPPFSGFFSKDAILLAAYQKSPLWWLLGLFAGLLTVWYMLRLYFVMFHGNSRLDQQQEKSLHDAGTEMAVPLVVLAVFSVAGGLLNIPSLFLGNQWLSTYLSSVIPLSVSHVSHATEWVLMGTSTLCVLGVTLFARNKYSVLKHVPCEDNSLKNNRLQYMFAGKFFVDEVYHAVIVNPVQKLSDFLFSYIDRKWIDGLVEGTGRLSLFLGSKWKETQNGFISYYLFAMALGMIGILVIFILL